MFVNVAAWYPVPKAAYCVSVLSFCNKLDILRPLLPDKNNNSYNLRPRLLNR